MACVPDVSPAVLMSSIIRMRNGVIGGLLLKVPAGNAPALGSYPQQRRLMTFRPLRRSRSVQRWFLIPLALEIERRGGKQDPNGGHGPSHPGIAVTGADDQQLHAAGECHSGEGAAD